MAFMVPEYTNEPMEVGTLPNGESAVYLSEFSGEYESQGYVRDSYWPKSWWYRLSANGYLDCTDWGGPFTSLAEAKLACSDAYSVDPDTGEDLPDES